MILQFLQKLTRLKPLWDDEARISSLVNKGVGQTVEYQLCTLLLIGSEKLRVHLAVRSILHCALSSPPCSKVHSLRTNNSFLVHIRAQASSAQSKHTHRRRRLTGRNIFYLFSFYCSKACSIGNLQTRLESTGAPMAQHGARTLQLSYRQQQGSNRIVAKHS